MPNFDTYHILLESGFANTQHRLLSVAFALGVYGPLIGGLVATWMDGGRDGLLDLWRRIVKWRLSGRWYLNALGIVFLLAALPTILFGLIGGFSPSRLSLGYILVLILVQVLRSGLGEEPGWRGYLLPRAKARFEGEKHIWVLGLIWSAWHFPIVIFRTLSAMPDVPLPQMVITVLVSLAGNVMSLIGMTYIYVWLYNRTESVFLAIVFHALSNVFPFWLFSFLAAPASAGLAAGLLPWLVVLFLRWRLGRDRFPG
jgi:membrane protease YdiL (CAAX protease family)